MTVNLLLFRGFGLEHVGVMTFNRETFRYEIKKSYFDRLHRSICRDFQKFEFLCLLSGVSSSSIITLKTILENNQ